MLVIPNLTSNHTRLRVGDSEFNFPMKMPQYKEAVERYYEMSGVSFRTPGFDK